MKEKQRIDQTIFRSVDMHDGTRSLHLTRPGINPVYSDLEHAKTPYYNPLQSNLPLLT